MVTRIERPTVVPAFHAEVEDQRARLPRVGRHERRGFGGTTSKPSRHVARGGMRRQATRASQPIAGERRLLGPPQPLQQRPGRRLADEQILVVRVVDAADGGDDHAQAEPEPDQSAQHVNLRLRERIRGVVPGHQRLPGRDRVLLAEAGVCARDRGLGDRPGPDHVAEIDQPRDPNLALGQRTAADENVRVVRIVVDDRAAELAARSLDRGLTAVGALRYEGAASGILDRFEMVADQPGRALRPPHERTVGGGGVHSGEHEVDAAQHLAELAHQGRAVRAGLAQRPSGHVLQQPGEAVVAHIGRRGDELARRRGEGPGEAVRQPRVRQGHGGVGLERDDLERLGGVRHLEHVPLSRSPDQQEVLVALARQLACLGSDPPDGFGQCLGLRAGQVRSGCRDRGSQGVHGANLLSDGLQGQHDGAYGRGCACLAGVLRAAPLCAPAFESVVPRPGEKPWRRRVSGSDVSIPRDRPLPVPHSPPPCSRARIRRPPRSDHAWWFGRRRSSSRSTRLSG